MICEIARNLSGEPLETIEALEHDLGLTLVAFSCRELEPDREERLRQIMEQFGPQLRAEPDEPDEAQIRRIQEAERALGLSLVAVRP
jgi:hypothetical protein